MLGKISLFCLFAAMAAACSGLWVELNRPVTNVRVLGTLNAEEQRQVRDAVGTVLGRGLLAVNLERMVAEIEALAWPRAVSVRRLWPAALEIRVDKEVPVARWSNAGFVTSDGKVMAFTGAPVGLPGFRCALSEPREAMEIYGLLEQAIAPAGLHITTLEETPLGEWRVELGSGVWVALGSDRLVERITRFRTVYENALAVRAEQLAYVDARYGNGIAVRWEEPFLAMRSE